MSKYHQPLLPDRIYHLFSRAVGNEKLFLANENYYFFLQKLKQHTAHVCRLYCYALFPNHFHLLAKINDEQTIISHFESVKKVAFQPLSHDLSDFVMERFSNLLNSYTKSFNKIHKRKGALFLDYMKRSAVNKDTDFTNYIWYIHKNAVHHQITKRVGEWPYDSYNSILSDQLTSLLREEIIEWFGSRESFIQFHQQTIYPKTDMTDID